ncbi:MAG: hypothetical protein WA749_07425 [Gelidibacter sp.]
MHPGGPFSIPAINNYIPEKLKPWIIILFVIVFQFASGGVYLATLNKVVGDQALMQEDILMAGYATLIGTALTFTIMLRLKMRFLSKHVFLICCAALIICNIICLYTSNVFVLIAVCFFAGIFRMWATFECNSTIQLWLTPTRDFSVFFCFIYLLVQGSILLSGSTHLYIELLTTWQHVHWVIMGALLGVTLIVLVIFNSKRMMPAFPLFGIDWLGMFMWGLIMLNINFIALYGKHYDWWQSSEIQIGTVFLMILLVLNIYRASFIRHPFISLKTFQIKIVYMTFLAYLIVDFFISPAHLIEEIYMHEILHYETSNLIEMNWVGFIGIALGAAFTYFYFAKAKNSYKSTFLIGFSSLVMYLLLMYFNLDYNTSQTTLGISVLFRNFGYVVIAIVLLTSLTKVPFPNFFQAISVQAIVSAACGSAVLGAVLKEIFSTTMSKNFQLLSMPLDRLNLQLMNVSSSGLGKALHHQAMMVSFKEIYGLMILLAILSIFIFIFYQNPLLKAISFSFKNKI